MTEHRIPEFRSNGDIEEAFDHVEFLNGFFVCLKPCADFLADGIRSLAGCFYPRKDDNCQVAFKFFAGSLWYYVSAGVSMP